MHPDIWVMVILTLIAALVAAILSHPARRMAKAVLVSNRVALFCQVNEARSKIEFGVQLARKVLESCSSFFGITKVAFPLLGFAERRLQQLELGSKSFCAEVDVEIELAPQLKSPHFFPEVIESDEAVVFGLTVAKGILIPAHKKWRVAPADRCLNFNKFLVAAIRKTKNVKTCAIPFFFRDPFYIRC
jgi:hypothetical protein